MPYGCCIFARRFVPLIFGLKRQKVVSLLQQAGVSKVAAALLTAVRQAVEAGGDATDAALALLQLVTHLCSLDFSEALVSGEQVLYLYL